MEKEKAQKQWSVIRSLGPVQSLTQEDNLGE